MHAELCCSDARADTHGWCEAAVQIWMCLHRLVRRSQYKTYAVFVMVLLVVVVVVVMPPIINMFAIMNN